VKFTQYFHAIQQRPDRIGIKEAWIEQVIANPIREEIQGDGRIRRWGLIQEAENRALRVILLPNGETGHNAFIDRRFTP
jgi:hypothetical protein